MYGRSPMNLVVPALEQAQYGTSLHLVASNEFILTYYLAI